MPFNGAFGFRAVGYQAWYLQLVSCEKPARMQNATIKGILSRTERSSDSPQNELETDNVLPVNAYIATNVDIRHSMLLRATRIRESINIIN